MKTFQYVNKTIFILLFFLLSLIFVVVVSCVVLLMFIKNSNESGDETSYEDPRIFRYKSLQHSKRSEESTYGIAEVLNPLPEEGFFFSENEDHYTLLTDFGTTDYICTGTCYCVENEDDENISSERRLLPNMKRMIFKYLLPGVSVAVVTVLATRYFRNKCDTEMSGDCGSGSKIDYEVNECEPVNDSSGKRTFFCDGGCIIDEFYLQGMDVLEKSADGEFEDVKFEHDEADTMDAVKKEFSKFFKDIEFICRYQRIGASVEGMVSEEEARDYFISHQLTDFCRKISVTNEKIDYIFEIPRAIAEAKKDEWGERYSFGEPKGHICVPGDISTIENFKTSIAKDLYFDSSNFEVPKVVCVPK